MTLLANEPVAVAAPVPSFRAAPSPRRPFARIRRHLRPSDALLPAALVCWLVGVLRTNLAATSDWGLFPAFPVVFYVSVGLLVASIVTVLAAPQLSTPRLLLHLGALVLVLHGTVPLLLDVPNYPWTYKHIGVVEYINAHGRLNLDVDIYHHWPGFFALAAWFTRIAGARDPVAYAAWAPVYFNALFCLELQLALRGLGLARRWRWLALFLFVPGNWVGQDYFAPQAFAFLLSLAVLAIVLPWFRVDEPLAIVRAVERTGQRLVRSVSRWIPGAPEDAGAAPASHPRTAFFLAAIFAIFAAVVVSHQLSPYMVLIGVGLLTAAGFVRPRWMVIVLAAIATGYLLLHLQYVERTQDLFGSLFNPFRNLNGNGVGNSSGAPGRVLALAAPALMLALWGLAALGGLRRLAARQPVAVLALLSGAPILVAFAQSYGGEAIFRIYLFSLPWVATLAAASLVPGATRARLAVKLAAVLAVVVALFMGSLFGSEELYRVRRSEVLASRYLYQVAEPGSQFVFAAPTFPGRIAANYDRFPATDSAPNLLKTTTAFRGRILGADDLPDVTAFANDQTPEGSPRTYFVLTADQRVYAEVLGQLPRGSLDGLDGALSRSKEWELVCRNADVAIFRAPPARTGPPPGDCRPAASPATPASHRWLLDAATLAIVLVGLGLCTLRRRRRREPAHDRRRPFDERFAPLLSVAEDERREVRRAAYRRLAVAPFPVLWHALGTLSRREEFCDVVDEEAPGRLAAVARTWSSSSETADRSLAVTLAIRAGTPECLEAAAAALTANPDGVPRMLRRNGDVLRLLDPLRSRAPERRLQAVALLGAIGGLDAAAALVGALEDGSPEVRERARIELERVAVGLENGNGRTS